MNEFHASPEESRPRLLEALTKLKQKKILIIGDVMIDRYVYGKVARISPEAPVPILHYSDEEERLGGAANVALNLKAMGAQTFLYSRIGEDVYGSKLKELLSDFDLSTEYLIEQAGYQTISKTRVVAGQQQLLRVDREIANDLAPEMLDKLLQLLNQEKFDAIVFSDYGKGMINAKLIEQTIAIAREKDIFTSLDPKKLNFPIYKHIDTMTPNHHEASEDVGLPFGSDAEIEQNAAAIMEKHDLKHLLITRGEKGMALIERGIKGQIAKPKFIPTFAKSVFDVCGAGDTVIAAFTAGRAAELSFEDAAILANAAAGIVVSKFGTAVATDKELRETI